MTHQSQQSAAAEQAVSLVTDGMLVGLGTGRTAAFAIAALCDRARAGLRITCVPTSEASAAQARAGGLPLLDEPPADRPIDLTIDGADEVEVSTLNLIKGLGAALLREKIVAACSKRLVIIADQRKRVQRLGERTPVPVEVVRFGWQTTLRRIRDLGGEPTPRLKDGAMMRTDGGNFILDCAFPVGTDMPALERALSATVGVIESGLFIGMTDTVLIGTETGVDVLRAPGA